MKAGWSKHKSMVEFAVWNTPTILTLQDDASQMVVTRRRSQDFLQGHQWDIFRKVISKEETKQEDERLNGRKESFRVRKLFFSSLQWIISVISATDLNSTVLSWSTSYPLLLDLVDLVCIMLNLSEKNTETDQEMDWESVLILWMTCTRTGKGKPSFL